MVATATKSLALGLESTAAWGTAVTRTVRLAGLTDVEFHPLPNVYRVPELGRMGPSKLTTLLSNSAEGTVNIDATHEHLIYLWQSVFGAVSASGTSGSGIFAYPFSAPSTGVPTAASYTGEYTDSTSAYLLNGLIAKTLNVSGKAGEVWKAQADFIARNMTTGVLTTTLADVSPLVNLIRMADTNLYIDISTGTVGTTVVSAGLIEFELSLESNYHTKLFGGAYIPGSFGPDKWDGSLRVMMELGSTARALFDALISTGYSTVVRQLEIRGAQSTSLMTQIQANGVITNNPELWGDRDGNRALEFVFSGVDSTTLGTWLKAIATIGSSTIT